jgi:class 3 adenylate cyclase/CheY-like chemotaxis protein
MPRELTFLFTDIEGSTRLVQRLGDGWAAVLEQHRDVIRAAIESHRGEVVDFRGDEFFAAFEESADAVAAAIAAQRELQSADWALEAPVKVRMGLHRGRAQAAGDGYVGLAVHHAARVCQAGRGGEILVSSSIDVEGLDLLELGEFALRGIPQATRLSRVLAPGLQTEFPPLEGAQPTQAPLRVVLADDSVLLREGVASLLEEAGFEVVGQAGTAEDLLALVDEALPDVAVVDIRMPPTKTDEGIRAAHEIRKRWPKTGVLVLSSYADPEAAVRLLADGAQGVGYLLKERVADVEEFTAAVRRVAAGGTTIDEEILVVTNLA